MGATESVEWIYFETTEEAIHFFKNHFNNGLIYAIEQADESIMLDDFIPDPGKRFGLIFGNEVNGIDDKALHLADGCIEIPQFGTKHSLNISVSAGIVIWELTKKMRGRF